MKRIARLLAISFLFLVACNLLIDGMVNANFMGSQLPFIYIKEDGSIDPATAPIQRNVNIYSFMSDISGYQVCIQCDNITLDGNGFALKCNPFVSGAITLEAKGTQIGRQNVVIRNLKIIESYTAIHAPWIVNCTFQFNIFQDCTEGMHISPATSNIKIINNSFVGHGEGIWLWGSSNIVSGNRFYNYRVAIEIYEGEHNVISDNIFSGVSSDLQIDNAKNTITSNNVRRTIPLPLMINLLISEDKYNSSSIPLVFSVNQDFLWAGYSLDNFANVTITGNTTLTELSNGNHSLVVYANNSVGMEKSGTINFTVAVPFPTALIITASVIVAVVGIGLLVYLKKRNHAKINKDEIV